MTCASTNRFAMIPVPTCGNVDGASEQVCTLDAICREFGLDNVRPQVQACRDAVEHPAALDVAVVGRFKSGKSSFLNYVLGRDVLPVGGLPLTAVVTRVSCGSQDRAVALATGGAEWEISLAELPSYVTERGNPDNERGVVLVDVEIAGNDAYRGIRFVDTPGLGSVHTHNTHASKQWLPRIGVALLAVSVEQPFAEDDAALLRELDGFTSEIRILLTKADLVAPGELIEIHGFVSQQAERALGRPVSVSSFSTRPGFDDIREFVKSDILGPLVGRREETTRRIISHKLSSVAARCRGYLEVALRAASAQAHAREHLADLLRHERRQIPDIEREIQLIVQSAQRRFRAEADARFGSYRDRLLDALKHDLRAARSGWDGNLRQEVERFRAWAHEALTSRLESISACEGKHLVAVHQPPVSATVSRMVHALAGRVGQAIEDALQIEFRGSSFEAKLDPPDRPDIHVGRVFDTPIDDVLWPVIPMLLVRPLVHRRMASMLAWESDKNLHRLAEQWTRAFEQSCVKLAEAAHIHIVGELDTLDRLLAGSVDQEPHVRRAIGSLGAWLAPPGTTTPGKDEQ